LELTFVNGNKSETVKFSPDFGPGGQNASNANGPPRRAWANTPDGDTICIGVTERCPDDLVKKDRPRALTGKLYSSGKSGLDVRIEKRGEGRGAFLIDFGGQWVELASATMTGPTELRVEPPNAPAETY